MSKIKIKDNLNRSIKTIDRINGDINNIKQKNINSEQSIEGQASTNIESLTKIATKEIYNYNLKNHNNVKEKIQTKFKNNIIKNKSVFTKKLGKNIKNYKREIKTANKSIKKTQKALKVSTKTINEIVKTSIKGIKAAIKISIEIIKAVINALKSLIAAIASGGWVSLIIIIAIALILLLCCSIYGIFFSSEKENDIKMSSVVKEVNNDLSNKIEQLKNNNVFDDYKLISHRAEWKDILAVYSVKYLSESKEDIMSITEEKKEIIEKLFWEFNSISSYISEEEFDSGKVRILNIIIDGKSKEEIMKQYSFSNEQINQVNELLSSEYSNMWVSVINGTSLGSPNMVEIALSQEGTKGGEPYWKWYGFDERIEWCACFVSWVADQLGLIESNIIPKFAGCQNGIDWFKAMGEWEEPGYIPKPGDIIFFDWEVDDSVSHVGIVEKVEDGKIYTIEGNSGDDVKRQKYSIDSKYIYGFGVPNY